MEQMAYDVFVVKTAFHDGSAAAFGGICLKGYAQACTAALSAVADMRLSPTKDGLFLDAQLADILRKIAPPQWRYAVASVHVPWPEAPCGGIGGNIWEEVESAAGTLAQLEPGLYGCAFPGACACLMLCGGAEASRFFARLREFSAGAPLGNADVRQLAAMADGFHGQLLLCTDGSGGSVGCILSKRDAKAEICWLR